MKSSALLPIAATIFILTYVGSANEADPQNTTKLNSIFKDSHTNKIYVNSKSVQGVLK